ncbi:AraC family transcriptional regulator [Chitinophaga arvensicola]|uniref:Helix-turn-helix domain-containing protein n=1 Tax=Chitinophaga arvensicola TaxID=29529 RepID=A0A1I0QU70_9BACT|nr:AraC family transcriptional regulator [Chitinophaga arvensicola]SEW31165.1 Helix-turn-helix domain-containing protein [Chitinophaga arvensicola]
MLLKFPIDQDGQHILKSGNTHFAMLKQRNKADKRTLFLKENVMIFVLSGYKLLHFDGGTVKVEAGSLLLMKRGFYIMSDFVEDGLQFKSLLLYFSDEQLRRFLHKFNYTTPVQGATADYLTLPITPLLEAFREQYLSYFSQEPVNLGALLSVKLYEVFLLLLASPQRNTVLAFLQQIVYAQPQDIAFIVKQHLFQPLTLAEMAKLSGRSLASFKRDFQQQYQSSPRRWINEQRLSYARTLLETTSQQVAEIAMNCGFESSSHFIRIFKQTYGITPSHIRAKKAII